MPVFTYAARNASGNRVHGSLEANDASALAAALSAQGLLLVQAQAQETSEEGVLAGLRTRWRNKPVNVVDMLLFCRQMATLLKAGVPLLRSLKGLEESTDKPAFAKVLTSLQHELEGGRELSLSMKHQPSIFSNYMINMVRVGELTGRLPDIFNGLAAQLSFERENRERISQAMRYPFFVLATAMAALVAVNVFVIPAFAKIYRGLKAELPVLTRVLINISDFAVNYWPALLGLAAAVGMGLWSFSHTQAGRRLRDGLILRIPVIGSLVHRAALARFTKSFGLALDAGVPLVEAISAALETADNVVISERIAEMRTNAERGESLARAAKATGIFTPTIIQMIAVGEETGALGEMMNEVAEYYQKEVDYAIKGLSAQIEPLLIIVLGGIILVFALGVFLPLWDLSRVAVR
ncbi:MAG TPA: type II secretion system F family protein [Burkholderiaceae bacterium]|nr:type II secretion system F family protein [Burkholderiaceae bacterium]